MKMEKKLNLSLASKVPQYRIKILPPEKSMSMNKLSKIADMPYFCFGWTVISQLEASVLENTHFRRFGHSVDFDIPSKYTITEVALSTPHNT